VDRSSAPTGLGGEAGGGLAELPGGAAAQEQHIEVSPWDREVLEAVLGDQLMDGV
jgi:hypothetical protein